MDLKSEEEAEILSDSQVYSSSSEPAEEAAKVAEPQPPEEEKRTKSAFSLAQKDKSLIQEEIKSELLNRENKKLRKKLISKQFDEDFVQKRKSRMSLRSIEHGYYFSRITLFVQR